LVQATTRLGSIPLSFLALRRLVATTTTTTMAAAAAASFASSTQLHRRQLKLGLAGDTMLGRLVAEHIFEARDPNAPVDAEREALPFFHQMKQQRTTTAGPPDSTSALFEPRLLDIVRGCELMFLNLECCISTSTQRWPNPHKPFFFRAPPAAIEELKALRVDAVTLGER
jgi:hypothetical protein